MALTWNPGIYRSGAFWPLPRPILSLKVTDEWDVDRQKPIKSDGEQVTGHSMKGVMIEVSGCINIQSGSAQLDETSQWAMYKTFRSKVDVSQDSDKYEFFIYYDSGGGIYEKYKSVSCLNLTVELGDDERIKFPYSAQFIADNTTIYTTAGGS
jgi:hypothetical protein